VGTSATAQTSAPADLSTIRGIDLALEGMGEYAQPGEPLTSSAVAQPVFFRNPPGI
jgi:hypothetical protein